MASFDYRLNPLYPIKECSSCGALYTMDYCCSKGSLGDKIICDLDKTPDLSQQPPQNCPKILQDASELSSDNINVVNALQDPFVVKQDPGKNSSQSPPQINHHCCYGCGDPLEDIFCHQCTYELCGNDAHYGYNCPSKVPIVPNPEPFNNQTVDELPQTLLSFDPTCYSEDGNSFTYDSRSDLVHDSPNVFDPPPQPSFYSCEFCGNDARILMKLTNKKEEKQIEEEQAAKTRYWKILVCYDDDDDDDYTIAIIHKEPDNSLSIRDEHLDTILATKSDEFIKSSVENLVPNPSESEGENECDSFSDEDIPKKIYSNPLFDEEIFSMKIDPLHFNAESDLIESPLNHDSLIISSSSSKIDSLFDEFAGKLTLLKSISSRINEADCDPEDETHLIKRLLYDNSSPYDDDSERDILILEELLSNDSLLLPENESFHFDNPSSSRPPAKPPDGNSGILNVKEMGDISDHKNSINDSPSISKISSQSPQRINHCCYECGDPLDGFFCKRCTCMSCGKDAHIGYNCPSKVSVSSNPKPCNNQTIDEFPQTLPSFHPTFQSEAESPFTLDSTPTYVDESPNRFNHLHNLL
nr:hypothetical protein [Tanacetum cinerariifolium]